MLKVDNDIGVRRPSEKTRLGAALRLPPKPIEVEARQAGRHWRGVRRRRTLRRMERSPLGKSHLRQIYVWRLQ